MDPQKDGQHKWNHFWTLMSETDLSSNTFACLSVHQKSESCWYDSLPRWQWSCTDTLSVHPSQLCLNESQLPSLRPLVWYMLFELHFIFLVCIHVILWIPFFPVSFKPAYLPLFFYRGSNESWSPKEGTTGGHGSHGRTLFWQPWHDVYCLKGLWGYAILPIENQRRVSIKNHCNRLQQVIQRGRSSLLLCVLSKDDIHVIRLFLIQLFSAFVSSISGNDVYLLSFFFFFFE